jgi:ribulose-phosphate 3-epimerase
MNNSKDILIAPSILSADFSRLGEEIVSLEKAGADLIHVDVMDGHFVPNITIGALVVNSIRSCTKIPFDVHLMISPTDSYIKDFADAGADHISIHLEAEVHLHRTISLIRSLSKKVGIAINPATPIEMLLPVIDEIDMVIVMSVNPGFAGQTFIRSTVDKIKSLKKMIGDRNILIEVDGGVTSDNARDCVAAGADILVAGSSIFKTPDYADNINSIRL